MPKATIQDLTDAGLRAQQFGNPADFLTANTGYLARVLNDVSTFVRDQVGASAYDGAAPGSVQLLEMRLAEKYFALAELWPRAAAFGDSDARAAAQENGAQTLGARAIKTSADLEDRAWGHLMRVAPGATQSGGVAVGHTQSGPFPEHSA